RWRTRTAGALPGRADRRTGSSSPSLRRYGRCGRDPNTDKYRHEANHKVQRDPLVDEKAREQGSQQTQSWSKIPARNWERVLKTDEGGGGHGTPNCNG